MRTIILIIIIMIMIIRMIIIIVRRIIIIIIIIYESKTLELVELGSDAWIKFTSTSVFSINPTSEKITRKKIKT